MHTIFAVFGDSSGFCGVENYTEKLQLAYERSIAGQKVEYRKIRGARDLIRYTVGKDRAAILHVQYPTMGSKLSVSAFLIPWLVPSKRLVLTLHEFELFNTVRKVLMIGYSITAHRIIFSNQQEKANFERMFPWAQGKTSVMPIGTNIEPVTPVGERSAQVANIIYFGQIAPGKGLEFFLETVRLMKRRGIQCDATVIGAVTDPREPVYHAARELAESGDITLRLNLSEQEVSKCLSDANIALLPFPGGVSDKRGSAMASLAHGLGLVTIHSPITPDWMKEISWHAPTPEVAVSMLSDISIGAKPLCPAPLRRAEELRLRDWHAIAEGHRAIYKKMVTGHQP